jgi:hypothetical protein
MAWIFADVLPIKNVKQLDPEIVGGIVEALPGEGDGKAEELVKAARQRRHYLHGSFEWNDQQAAHQHRLEQARKIIRCLWWVEKPGAEPVRGFASITTGADGGAREYFSYTEIITNASLQRRMMETAKNDLVAWIKRYRNLKKAAPMIESAITTLDAEIKRQANDLAA